MDWILRNMKLSILLLTHNRPALFKYCIESALMATRGMECEILVNNDTNDITEVYDPRIPVKYSTYTSDTLTDIYQYLYDKAQGDYVCYLEDDDYYLRHMFNSIDYKHDMYMTEYISEPLINEMGIYNATRRLTINRKHKKRKPIDFFSAIDDRDFQLGQMIFKKCDVDFPVDDNIRNDIILTRRVAEKMNTIKYLEGYRWVQTTNGQDNISFPELNIDERF